MREAMKELMWKALDDVRRQRAVVDPEWRELERRSDELYAQFMEKHRNDPALREEMLQLVNAQFSFLRYKGEVQFYLGLQMGLELGSLDLMGF